MRLLVYSDMSSAPWGGSEVLWSRLAPLLRRRGTIVAVTAFSSKPARQACQNGGVTDVFLLPRSTVRTPQPALPKTLSRLSGRAIRKARQRVWLERQRRFCERFGADVAFVSMAWPDAATGLHPFLRKSGVPYVCFLHGISSSYTAREASAERRLLFRNAAYVFTTGQRSAEMLQQWLGEPLDNVIPTLNFVDCDYFAPPTARSDSSPAAPVRLLSVARLSLHDKGQDVLLESLAQLRDLNWRLTLAGDGPDRPHLEDQATRLDIQDRLDFPGDVSSAQVRRLLHSHDLFVLSSRIEGLPLSLLEAMACGVPCVATDVGSVREVLLPDESGLLVRPEDPTELAQATRRMIEDIALRRRCAARAQTIVRQQCDAPAFLDRVAGLIEQIALDSRNCVA